MKTYHFPDMSVWNILDQLLVINSILRTRENANRPYGGKSKWEQEIVSGLALKGRLNTSLRIPETTANMAVLQAISQRFIITFEFLTSAF